MENKKQKLIVLVSILMIAFTQLPFAEAIDFLREKTNLPTRAWTDIQRGMHSRAFVVAGAMRSELLSDFHESINQAVEKGTTLAMFRKDFDTIVSRHGWSYKGSRGWRTATIFNTNMRTAYAAGHYRQMTRPAVIRARPMWRYVGGLSGDPRPLHLDWSGTILPANHPWFSTHYPPNGWGCRCKVVTLSNREMSRRGLKKSPQAPRVRLETRRLGNTGRTVEVPAGIDVGWDYNPGAETWEVKFAEASIASLGPQENRALKEFARSGFRTAGRPSVVPGDSGVARRNFKIPRSVGGIRKFLEGDFGGKAKVFSFEGAGVRHDVVVSASSLSAHLRNHTDRASFLPFISEILESPYEIWGLVETNKKTGKVAIKKHYIKKIKAGGTGLFVVAEIKKSVMTALTFFPISDDKKLNTKRKGVLLWGR